MEHALDKLIPPAPTALGPLEWIAVVVVGVLLSVYLVNSLILAPRAGKAQTLAINDLAKSHEVAMDKITTAHERAVDRIHDRLDGVELACTKAQRDTLQAIHAARRDIVRLECFHGDPDTEEVPVPRIRLVEDPRGMSPRGGAVEERPQAIKEIP